MKIETYSKELNKCVLAMLLALTVYIIYVALPIEIASILAFVIIGIFALGIKKPGHSLCMALVFQLCFNFIYDITTVYLGVNVDYSAMMCVDLWLVILLFRHFLMHKNIKNCSVPILLMILLIVEFIGGLLNPLSTAYQAFKGFVMLIRYFSAYLIACEVDYDFYKLFKFLYPICILLILIECVLGFHVDSRNGFFGVYGSGACMLFIGIRFGIILSQYINKEKRFIAFSIEYIFIMIVMLLTENKAMMVVFNVAVLLALIVYKNKWARRIGMFVLISIGLLVGMRLITMMYPKFGVLFTYDGIYNYLLGNSNGMKFQYGRFEAGLIAFEFFCNTPLKRIFGVGLGTAFPPENIYHILNEHGSATYNYILESLGTRQGYYLSGFSCILLEMGIIGVLVLFLLVASQYILSIKMLRGNSILKEYGMVLLCIACANTYYMIYGNAFTFVNQMVLSLLIMGICKRKYFKEG